MCGVFQKQVVPAAGVSVWLAGWSWEGARGWPTGRDEGYRGSNTNLAHRALTSVGMLQCAVVAFLPKSSRQQRDVQYLVYSTRQREAPFERV